MQAFRRAVLERSRERNGQSPAETRWHSVDDSSPRLRRSQLVSDTFRFPSRRLSAGYRFGAKATPPRQLNSGESDDDGLPKPDLYRTFRPGLTPSSGGGRL
jgi:hypothetical protein